VSQPLNFGPNQKDPLAIVLTKADQLLEIFYQSEVKSGAELMGIEYEFFAHDTIHEKPLSYEGSTSITSLFSYLIKQSSSRAEPWQALIEYGNIVALDDSRATIALEPGGQIEIAAKPHNNIHDVNTVFKQVVHELNMAALDLGINLFAVGIHPLATRNEMGLVKKSRYAIMRNYMKGLKNLGLDMMTRTCSIQLNLDFNSEEDMVKKVRLAAFLSPILSLLCSSSAFLEGKPTKHALERGFIWQQTDPARTGIPAMIFSPTFGYNAYIQWALDVPMYFIRRESRYLNVAGASFRDFMAHGLLGEQALMRDFVDHLSTIFTEIRLKPFLELRSCDSLPEPYVCALSSLVWALFYEKTIFDKIIYLYHDLSYEEIIKLHDDAITIGKEAKLRGRKIFDIAQELLDLAAKNNYEIEAFQNLISKNITCAEFQKDNYKFITKNNISQLINTFSITAPLVI
jgi:glutamate--cysteine ligase